MFVSDIFISSFDAISTLEECLLNVHAHMYDHEAFRFYYILPEKLTCLQIIANCLLTSPDSCLYNMYPFSHIHSYILFIGVFSLYFVAVDLHVSVPS